MAAIRRVRHEKTCVCPRVAQSRPNVGVNRRKYLSANNLTKSSQQINLHIDKVNIRKEEITEIEKKTLIRKRKISLFIILISTFFVTFIFIYLDEIPLKFKIIFYSILSMGLFITIFQYRKLYEKEMFTGKITKMYKDCDTDYGLEYFILIDDTKSFKVSELDWNQCKNEDIIEIHKANGEILTINVL
jgi:hypothetical protein